MTNQTITTTQVTSSQAFTTILDPLLEQTSSKTPKTPGGFGILPRFFDRAELFKNEEQKVIFTDSKTDDLTVSDEPNKLFG